MKMIMAKVNLPPSLTAWPKLTSFPISVTSLVAARCPLLPRNRRPRLQKLLNLRNFVLILRKSWRFFCWKSGGKSPFAGTSQSEEKSFLNLTKSWRIFLSKKLGKSRPRLHELLNLSFGIWDLHIYIGEKAISCHFLAVQTSSIGDLVTAQSLRVFTFDRPLRHFVSQNSWKQQFTKR